MFFDFEKCFVKGEKVDNMEFVEIVCELVGFVFCYVKVILVVLVCFVCYGLVVNLFEVVKL